MKFLPTLMLTISAAIACNGCFVFVGSGSGGGGYSVIKGELYRIYPVDLNTAWAASEKALEGFSLKVSSKQKDGLGGRINAERADGTKIALKFESNTTGTTTIRIHVGTLGNQNTSEEIMGAIGRNIKPDTSAPSR